MRRRSNSKMKRNIIGLVLIVFCVLAGMTYFKDIKPEVKTVVATVEFDG